MKDRLKIKKRGMKWKTRICFIVNLSILLLLLSLLCYLSFQFFTTILLLLSFLDCCLCPSICSTDLFLQVTKWKERISSTTMAVLVIHSKITLLTYRKHLSWTPIWTLWQFHNDSFSPSTSAWQLLLDTLQ